MDNLWAIAGVIITTASLVYAIKTNLEKRRLERFICESLAGVAGGIETIQQNPAWADLHFAEMRDKVAQMSPTEDTKDMLKHIMDGARDVCAATRSLEILLGDVVTIQRGLFGKHEIRRPDQLHEKAKEIAEQEDGHGQ